MVRFKGKMSEVKTKWQKGNVEKSANNDRPLILFRSEMWSEISQVEVAASDKKPLHTKCKAHMSWNGNSREPRRSITSSDLQGSNQPRNALRGLTFGIHFISSQVFCLASTKTKQIRLSQFSI